MLKKFLIFVLMGVSSTAPLNPMKRGFDAITPAEQPTQPHNAGSISLFDETGTRKPVKKLKTNDKEAVFDPLTIDQQPNLIQTPTSAQSAFPLLSSVSSTPSSVSSSSLSTSVAHGTNTVREVRPVVVQATIDKVFNDIKNVGPKKWGFDGSSNTYGMLGLNDELVIKSLASKKDKENIYIIDVGCGVGNWGAHVMDVLLHDEVCRKSGKQFYIMSITGGVECNQSVQITDNVTHYRINQFKIENIDKELSQRGFHLKSKVDLIVSHWTLRHLVDPCGTLVQLYNLLTPLCGLMLAGDFLFAYEGSDTIEVFPSIKRPQLNFLFNAKVVSLCFSNQDVGEFLVIRTNDQEATISLEYAGDVQSIPMESIHQNQSKVVTVFKKGKAEQRMPYFLGKGSFEHSFYYCNAYNQRSIKLYENLKQQGFFS